MKQTDIRPANGKLGIMVVGCGAVTTTFMTGVLMARKGLTKPVGSMTQYDKIRVGKGNEKKYLHYADIVPLASLDDIVFGTWDVYPQNAYQAAMYAEVLKEKDIEPVRDELEKIVPMKAAFDKMETDIKTGNVLYYKAEIVNSKEQLSNTVDIMSNVSSIAGLTDNLLQIFEKGKNSVAYQAVSETMAHLGVGISLANTFAIFVEKEGNLSAGDLGYGC